MPGTDRASRAGQAIEAHLPLGGLSGCRETAEALCEPLLRSAARSAARPYGLPLMK
ncbi:MAG: hypothetical protein IOC72_09925 [Rhodobacter sp.]|nr:hypothetical protein [Rhodobacter sp.]MCA3512834.1 hypothetical protein [Rhodobacter sp.]MCA3521300.1 hypothetical protein [Rhodobacter sp.]MCA3523734.1 hypothetical protein [Rhodobacter sp.]MCA3548453.1 hypothetical protein [Rhodobacter sp.]